MENTVFTGHKGAVYALCAAGEGAFYSGGGDGLVVRWHLDHPDAGELVANASAAVFALASDEARGLLYIGDEHGGLHVIDQRARKEVFLEQHHRKGLFRITPMADGRVLCAGGDGVLSAWRADGNGTLVLQRSIPLSEGKLRDHALSPDGRWIAVACADGHVRVLDATDLNERYTLAAAAEGASCVAWHPGKPVLLAGGKDGQLRFWHSSEDFRALQSLPLHSGTIYAAAFSPDGTRCATASRDKHVKLWDANTFDPLVRLDRQAGGHAHSVNALLWLGGVLLSASDDKHVVAWV
ncbi:MAG TPA: hypothetical protein VHL57_11325 [Flavobacteriales bacterium]|nr:hypothetical protein [Flavobacteriales bacterium]